METTEKKKQNRTATNQINFRVTDEEMVILRANAEKAGFSKTPMYCKRLALGVKVKPQVISKELGQAMLPIIGHMGSNINQLAKKANEGGTVAAAELAEVKAEFEKLWDLVLYGKKPQQSKEKKLEVAGQTVLQEKKEKPHCELCGAELVAGERSKDNSPIWFCPNWKDQSQGKHSIFDRKE